MVSIPKFISDRNDELNLIIKRRKQKKINKKRVIRFRKLKAPDGYVTPSQAVELLKIGGFQELKGVKYRDIPRSWCSVGAVKFRIFKLTDIEDFLMGSKHRNNKLSASTKQQEEYRRICNEEQQRYLEGRKKLPFYGCVTDLKD